MSQQTRLYPPETAIKAGHKSVGTVAQVTMHRTDETDEELQLEPNQCLSHFILF